MDSAASDAITLDKSDLSALSSDVRIGILRAIDSSEGGTISAAALADEMSIGKSTLHQHLAVLETAGIICGITRLFSQTLKFFAYFAFLCRSLPSFFTPPPSSASSPSVRPGPAQIPALTFHPTTAPHSAPATRPESPKQCSKKHAEAMPKMYLKCDENVMKMW